MNCKDKSYFVLFLVSLITYSISFLLFVEIYAESPSFFRQEITDKENDWEPWNRPSPSFAVRSHDNSLITLDMADMGKNLSECKINGNFIFPDIESVSYKSDGKTLDGTIWLTEPFEQLPLNDTLDTYQEEMRIKVTEENTSFENYTIIKKTDLNLFDIKIENFTLSGKPAYKIVYNDTSNEERLVKLNIWTVYGNKSYDIVFSAEKSKYNKFYDIALDMIKSFIIKEGGHQQVKNGTTQGKRIYEDALFRLNYPLDWLPPSNNKEDKSSIVVVKSPFENLKEKRPSWHEVTFIMALDLNSVYDSGTDYRIIYTRMPHGLWTGNWTRQVQEVSAHDKAGFMNETNDISFMDKRSPDRIPFSINLDDINSPEQYKIVFNIVDTYIIGHHVCRFVDTSNWLIVPPPHFIISTSPTTSILRPGEQNNVVVQIKGITDLPAQASFSVDDIPFDVNATFTPDNVVIPPSSVGTTTLNIKALNNNNTTISTEKVLRIKAKITFPTTITNRGGDTFSNNESVTLDELASFTLTVLPDYTDSQKLANFVNSWIDPISGLWTFLAGIGTAISPLIIYLYKNRKNTKQNIAISNEKLDKEEDTND